MAVATEHHHVGLKSIAEVFVKTGEDAVEENVCECLVTNGSAVTRNIADVLFTELNPMLTGLRLALIFQVFLGSGRVSNLVGDDARQNPLQAWFTFFKGGVGTATVGQCVLVEGAIHEAH